MAINTILHTNEQSVDRVLGAGLPVALVFWGKGTPLSAEWKSTLDELAAQYAGKLLIAMVNTEEETGLRQRYQVNALPSIILIKSGKTEAQLPSKTPVDLLKAWSHYLVNGGTRPVQPQPQHRKESTTSTDTGHPITLSGSNFDRLIQGDQPVLVDFWAPWCGPCRMVAPAVEETARAFAGRAVVGKLNVDENQQIAQRYQIMGIPALYIFKGGQVVDQMVGVQSAQVIQQHLNRHVN